MNFRTIISAFLALFTWLICPGLSRAQGTAFTYRGYLRDDSTAANGLYDLSFGLYNGSAGGVPVTGILTNNSVPVANGLFVVLLDFGDAFDGSDYWLELGVRNHGSGKDFHLLAPRQHFTPTPYALHAASATTTTGSISDTQLSGNIPRLNSNTDFSGALSAQHFNGDGSGLSNVLAKAAAVPTGTGFYHITGGAPDATSRPLVAGDIPDLSATYATLTTATNAVYGAAHLRSASLVPTGAKFNYTFSGGPNSGLAGFDLPVTPGARYYYHYSSATDAGDLFLQNGSNSIASGNFFTASHATVILVGLEEGATIDATVITGFAQFYGDFSGTASNLTDIPIAGVETLATNGVFKNEPLSVKATGAREHFITSTNTLNGSTLALVREGATGYSDIGFYINPTGGNSPTLYWAMGMGAANADFPYKQPFFESYLGAYDIFFVGAGTIYGGFLRGDWTWFGASTNAQMFRINRSSNTISNNVPTIFSSTVTHAALTPSTVPYLNANKVMVSSSTTPAELGYLHNVTSAIQTQLDAKAAIASPAFTGIMTGNGSGLTSLNGASLLANSVNSNALDAATKAILDSKDKTVSMTTNFNGSGTVIILNSAFSLTSTIVGTSRHATNGTDMAFVNYDPAGSSAGHLKLCSSSSTDSNVVTVTFKP